MATFTPRKTERLRLGRVSAPGARYFVTVCTRWREPALAMDENAVRVLAAMSRLEADGDWQLLAATVMQDHLHGLFELGGRLPLGRVMAKLKNFARPSDAPWRWQGNEFEHRLRADEATEDYAFYIFMNPYRAGLVGMRETWPWWRRNAEWAWRFEAGLDAEGRPQAEWLGLSEGLAERICAGE